MDLLTYLMNYEPDELIRESENRYSTKTHKSLIISNGAWDYKAKMIGGYTALDYLVEVRGITVVEAATRILDISKSNPPVIVSPPLPNSKNRALEIPPKDPNGIVAYKYLRDRGIGKNILFYCFKNDLIYQTTYIDRVSGRLFKNVCFVGYDADGNVRHIFMRGTDPYKDFKHDAAGSNKMFSFRLSTRDYMSREVHVFESCIDLLSYATLLEQDKKDWRTYNMLSLNGVYVSKKNMLAAPLPLELYLKNNPHVEAIITHFDNDDTGRYATQIVKTIYEDKRVIDDTPQAAHDVNAMLLKVKSERAGLSLAR